jgi:hypothetical protein
MGARTDISLSVFPDRMLRTSEIAAGPPKRRGMPNAIARYATELATATVEDSP